VDELKIPFDYHKNLEYRSWILQKGRDDSGFARSLRQMLAECSAETISWWMSVFCYTYNPMFIKKMRVPFILWDFQISDIIEPIVKHINMGEDLLCKKSRKMGFTWTSLGVLTAFFLYYPEPFSSLLISRGEKLVDSTGNPDSLFWKVKYLIGDQPLWLLPSRDDIIRRSVKCHMDNPENGAVMDGEATTKNMSAGGRRNVIFLDEFARVERGLDTKALSATRDATPCRIFGSTSEGRGTEFYNIEQGGTTACIYIHWSKHPEGRKGLYKERADGTVEVIDDYEGEVELYRGTDDNKDVVVEKHAFPDNYPFLAAVNDPELRRAYPLRSPWFDSQCNRRPSIQEIAQQLEMDDGKAGVGVFDDMVLDRVEEKDCMDPIVVGRLPWKYNPHTETVEYMEFEPSPDGDMGLWCELGSGGRPPQLARYVLGCDISHGTGASNSTAVAYNVVTGEQVLEYATPHKTPEQFAQVVVAICKWLGGIGETLLCWEKNGPGSNFGMELHKLGWHKVYREGKTTGWHSNTGSKREVMSDLRSSLARGDCVPRSHAFLQEARQYIEDDVGNIIIARVADMKSGAREAHGDRVIAHAICNMMFHKVSKKIDAHLVLSPPEGSWEWRRRRREKKKRNREYWSAV